MKALEQTLNQLTARNDNYKSSLRGAGSLSKGEEEEKQVLLEQSQALNEVLYKKRKLLKQLEKDEEADKGRLEEIRRSAEYNEGEIRKLMAAKESLDARLKDMHERLNEEGNHLEEIKKGREGEVEAIEANLEGELLKLSNEATRQQSFAYVSVEFILRSMS